MNLEEMNNEISQCLDNIRDMLTLCVHYGDFEIDDNIYRIQQIFQQLLEHIKEKDVDTRLG